MKRFFIAIMAFLACSGATVDAAVQAKKIIKQMKKSAGVTITYGRADREDSRFGTRIVVCGDQQRNESMRPGGRDDFFPKETTYVDYGKNTYYQTALLSATDTVCSKREFEVNKGFKVVADTTFLGFKCKIARTIINSNTMEVWYTTDLGVMATPTPSWGVTDGVVLRYSRNGQNVQVAKEIEPLKEAVTIMPKSLGKEMDPNYYRFALNNCNVITVPVFNDEAVNFTGAKAPEKIDANVTYRVGGGSIILKKITLPKSSDRDVFVELTQYSKGDAYDRTGSVFIIPVEKEKSFLDMIKDLKSVPGFTANNGIFYPGLVSTPTYDVPLELMRFFTGFGVRQFNYNVVPGQKWVESVLYKMNVTNLASQLEGEVIVGAYIGNWDSNGHSITLNMKYYPGDEDVKAFKHAKPLFNTVNYLEQAGQEYPVFLEKDVLKVKFTLAEDAPNAHLVYLTTGHGGWGGGDEFNRKVNTLMLDGEKVVSFIPWRDDCATYRNNNPCSGNFPNGESSSDLSRSNWCPGTVTNPNYIPLGDLKAGEHEITVQIPQGAREGGSMSYWCLSGTLVY
ncbi:MAG: PNGase F N-terminal domain-containing protein [Muribaculaceae bacterium]